ncbi:MAG TPA: hypothetical protein HPP83_07105 [Candidatus Hydrogenedentes bacterium]|nr:hypothetical protein [Candidatus Hydrogenedentota bacterium]
MDIIKTVVIMVVALAVGAAGGVLAAKRRLNPQLAASASQSKQLKLRCAILEQGLAEAEAQMRDLEAKNEALQEEMAAMEKMAEAAPYEENLFPFEGLSDQATVEPRQGIRRMEAGAGAQDGVPTDDADLTRRRERETRRREWMERGRERYRENMAAALDNETDEAARERIAAIEEYGDYAMDLMQQMRAAETDEERAALREELGEVFQTSRALVYEQQEHMLRRVAEQHGIGTPSVQDSFVDAMRHTLTSPFFRTGGPGALGPGGRGGPGLPFSTRGGRPPGAQREE